MWNFNLNTSNEKNVISGIDEMARLNFGGFFIEAGGRPQGGKVDSSTTNTSAATSSRSTGPRSRASR